MTFRSLKLGCSILSASVCLLLLLPTVAIWFRSHLLTDDIYWNSPHRLTRVHTSGGGLWFETRPQSIDSQPTTSWQKFEKALYPFAANEKSPLFERCGFLFSTKGYDLLFVMPYWSVAAMLSLGLILSVVTACKIVAADD